MEGYREFLDCNFWKGAGFFWRYGEFLGVMGIFGRVWDFFGGGIFGHDGNFWKGAGFFWRGTGNFWMVVAVVVGVGSSLLFNSINIIFLLVPRDKQEN